MLAFLLLLTLISRDNSQQISIDLPLGQIVEKVTCARDPNQSYALYLPKNYDKNRKWPVLYAFDPARNAVLLIGGDKTGNDRWYEIFVPLADRIYGQYLKERKGE